MDIFSILPKRDISLVSFIKSEFTVLIISFCFTFTLNGQGVTQLELKFKKLNHSLETELVKLDSLYTVHDKMISAIDNEKQIEPANENKIKEMLASTVVVSNQIKEQQIKLNKIEAELESVKVNLDRKYTTKIDSLKTLEKSQNNSIDNVSLKSQKLKYIEKRLIVAPKIYSLSFDPQKLIYYKPLSKDDSLEQIILKEYLSNALVEVNQQSLQLAFLKKEIEEVVHLQNEANDFIEDVDSEMLFNPALQTTQSSTKNNNVFLGGNTYRLDEEISNIYSQANSYLHIFNQLKTSTNIDIQSPWQTPTDTIPSNLTFQQYLDLLKEVDKMLQDYRTVLEHKMESN